MPEILEIEMYRRAADAVVGRTIATVDAPDSWYLKDVGARAVRDALVGASIDAVARVGKLLLVETSRVRCGLRFGMTGRLVIDGQPVIEALEYSSPRLDPAWNRFGLGFRGGGGLTMNDPRRLGGLTLDPDVRALGPDAWCVTSDDLRSIAAGRRVSVKSLLLDQRRVAGLGNLLVDELLWRCGIAPDRMCSTLDDTTLDILGEALPTMLDELFERGGSHRGDLFPHRVEDGRCPRDRARLEHRAIAGRSTWWCPTHQR